MPSSSDSLRSAGSKGLNGRMAKVGRLLQPLPGPRRRDKQRDRRDHGQKNGAPAASSADGAASMERVPSLRWQRWGAGDMLAGTDARSIAPRHLGDEPITLASNGRDVAVLTAHFAQHLAQGRDVLREAVLLDDHARPDRAAAARPCPASHPRARRDRPACRKLLPFSGMRRPSPGAAALLADVQDELAEFIAEHVREA